MIKLTRMTLLSSLLIGTLSTGGCETMEAVAKTTSEKLNELEQAIQAANTPEANAQTPKVSNNKPSNASKPNSKKKPSNNTADFSSTFTYEVIGRSEKHNPLDGYTINEESHSIARIEQSGSRVRVVHNNVPGPEFNTIESLIFSPDGKRLGYFGTTSDEEQIVIDGKVVVSIKRSDGSISILPPKKAYTSSQESISGTTQAMLTKPRILFSPNSERYAVIQTSSTTDSTIIVDGVRMETAGGIGVLRFTEKNTVVYSATGNGTHYSVEGVKGPDLKGPDLKSLGDIQFSADGERYLYTARQSLSPREEPTYINHKLVYDPKEYNYRTREVGETEKKSKIVYSDNLQHTAVIVYSRKIVERNAPKPTNTKGLFVNGQKVASLGVGSRNSLGPNGNCFLGPNGETIYQGIDSRIVVKGQTHRDYATLENALFSPDGSRVYYLVQTDNFEYFLVDQDNNEVGPLSEKIVPMSFSPDSKHFAYFGNDELFVDGQALLNVKYTRPKFWFGEDSKQIFVTKIGKAQSLQEIKAKAKALGLELVPVFPKSVAAVNTVTSQDDRFTAKIVDKYHGHQKGHEYWITINGARVQGSFSKRPIALQFDDHGTLRMIAVRGDEIVRCTSKH